MEELCRSVVFMRYERQRLIAQFKDLDECLSTKRIAVIGSGGLGGLCIYMLAGAGVLNFTVADDDVIEDSNLHRQILFNEQDLGLKKSECCRRELLKLDKRIDVRCFGRVNADNFEEFADKSDLVMDLSDNIATRVLASNMCCRLKKDLIHASVAESTGMLCAFRFSDQKSTEQFGCYQCFAGSDPRPQFRGITGPWAGAMACNAAALTMDYFAGEDIFGTLWLYDQKKRSIQKIRLRRDPHCKCCSST